MENTLTGVTVPLSTFGGLSTELSPADLPEGGSPDNSDCAFIPGSAMTRPALKRLYTTEPESTTVLSQKTFTGTDGAKYNVKLYVSGNLYVENFTSNPGVWTLVSKVAAGSYFKSVESFGKLFLAFNDGLRGTDIPRQFDGQNFRRVTQSGPGANPCIVQDYANKVAIVSISDRSGPQAITAATQLGSTATITTANAHGLKTGDLVLVDSVGVAGYNGTWKVTAVPSPTTFDYTASTTGLGASSGGNEYPLVAVVTTSIPHNLIVGDIVVITGNTNTAYNNNVASTTPSYWTVSAVPTDTTFEFQRVTGTGGGSGTSVFVSVDGKVMPWSVPLNPSFSYGINDGSAPVVLSFSLSAGNVISLTASGSVKPSDSRPYAPPDGTPPPTGSTSGSMGHGFPTRYMPGSTLGLSGVCGAFCDAGGHVIQAVSIGSHATVTCPTGATQLQIGVNDDHFSDNVGSFYVTATLAAAGGAGGTGGTVDIGGLSAAGEHLMVVMFETDTEYITAPSIPIKFSTAGMKKLQISNIPTGPSNVTKRILGFTGADGGNFFAILVPAQSTGTVVSTSTVIDNNTDTSVVLDFSDETLLSATGIDVDGNDLFNLRTLGRCSGVDAYADRSFWWGDENNAINLANMGFEGGVDPATGIPYGWSATDATVSVVSNGDYGDAVQFAAGSTAVLSQPAFQDYYGDAILEPDTQYTFQCGVLGFGASVVAEIFDPVSGMVLSSVTLAIPSIPGYVSGKFSAKTPAVIPSTVQLRIRVINNASVAVRVDELSVIFSAKPYNDTTFWGSYVNNPESVDGVTGKIGATVDPTPIMDTGRLRDNFYFVTQRSLQTTKNLANSEPSGWDVNEISEQCGACTMQSMVEGENWISWTGADGRRMFDGSEPIKITQDVQRLWDSLDLGALTKIQSLNDVTNRRIYDRVTVGGIDKLYVLDYRYGETGSDIENRASVRVSPYTGKMLVIELSRKFSPWTVPATAIGMLSTTAGTVPCISAANGRSYRFDPTQYFDDDFGPIPAYYVTSPFVSGEMEQQLQLGNGRHLYTFLSAMISGTGLLTVTPLVDVLDNPWPVRGPYRMKLTPNRPMELGLNVSGSRVFFKVQVVPDNRYLPPGSQDANFNLSRMAVTMQQHPYSPVYGAR